MLEHAAEDLNCRQRGREATAVVAFNETGARARTARPVTPPPLAGRVRDNRVRATVFACIAI